MLFEALEAARDLGRLQEIATVLIRHGLGDLVRRMGLARFLERAGRALHWRGAEELASTPTPVHLRRALEELGPTFVKLGQVLAGRADLLGPAWIAELEELQEHVAASPSEAVRAQLLEDLGARPEEVFARFDEEPLAAGSIAQIHRARLSNGSEVVLKIRRPGIREVVEADLRLLQRLAERLESEVPEARRFRPRGLARGFARTLRDELDLSLEARNAERLRAVLANEEGVFVPRVFPELSGERLLVEEYLPGESLGARIRGRSIAPELGPVLAQRGAHAYLRMVFVAGFFHADPHPGNVVLLADGRLGLLDFGMVGRLTERRKRELFDLAYAVARRDEEALVDVLLNWADEGELDLARLTLDCSFLIDRYGNLSLEKIDAGRVLQDIAALLRENDLFLPPDVASLLKLFVTLEGLGSALDPEFVMTDHLAPFAERELRARRSPRRILVRGLREISGLLSGLPDDVRSTLRRVRRGRVRMRIEVGHLEELGHAIEHSSNRLTLGLVTAALIVGTSIAMHVPVEPFLFGLPLFGLLGFVSSLVAGFWVVWSILRSDRR